MAPWIIDDWQSGKKSRKGIALPPEEQPPREVVTVCPVPDALDVFGCHDRPELADHLRKLRTRGILISEPGRLTARVRIEEGRGPGKRMRAYVTRGAPPRYRPRRRVINW